MNVKQIRKWIKSHWIVTVLLALVVIMGGLTIVKYKRWNTYAPNPNQAAQEQEEAADQK